MSSSPYIDNKKKDILILGIGLTDRLDETTLTTEKVFNKFYRTGEKFSFKSAME